jgi:hypothetical protein
VQDGLSITLDGRYPDARYASFASYDAGRNSFTGPDGAPSVLTDHRIDPDRGSGNPYRDAHARAGGKFTVTVTDRAPAPRNALPLSPAGTPEGAQGTVIYRVYLPHGAVRLPKVTFHRDGHRVHVTTCAAARSRHTTPPTTTAEGRAAAPARPVFTRSGADTRIAADGTYTTARTPTSSVRRSSARPSRACRASPSCRCPPRPRPPSTC